MVYAAAVVSLLLLVAGLAVVVGMILPNVRRISDALYFGRSIPAPRPTARTATAPRLIAVRRLMHAPA